MPISTLLTRMVIPFTRSLSDVFLIINQRSAFDFRRKNHSSNLSYRPFFRPPHSVTVWAMPARVGGSRKERPSLATSWRATISKVDNTRGTVAGYGDQLANIWF
jgi:hypothetical protein